MKTFPVEFQILDDENEHRLIATIKGFDEDSIELTINDFLLSSDDEIDKLADSLKKCLKMYQAGLDDTTT
jgi:hypothetical protein